MAESFIPEGALKSKSRYFSVEDGKNSFRFIGKPVVGWEAWQEVDGKSRPVRFAANNKPEDETIFKQNAFGAPVVNFFMAFIAQNMADNSLGIFQTTKKAVIKGIDAINVAPEWDGTDECIISITKEGKGMETKYTVMPAPRGKAPEADKDEIAGINLSALFTGKDPFADTSSPVPVAAEQDDVTFVNEADPFL